MNNVGKRISLQRKKIGLTQNELAEKLMVSNKAVSKWESNAGRPSFDFIHALCEMLDCSADYLIFGENTFEQYKRIKNGILVNIGKNEKGEDHFEDILKFPHLLVIGETGSGKSTLFHSFIVDIIKNYTKEKVNLGLIDCKGVEFDIYKSIPHLMQPIATKIETAVELLENAMFEMDRRYSLFQNLGIRNIQQYNEMHKEKMPYNIIIIDELAEIISNARAKQLIIHLIKIARASGTHLIIGTQRLRSDTLPYELKEFILTRICFKVDIREQSEEYFKFAGGEELNGNGEMLFYKSNYKRLLKLQGNYYKFNEIAEILKENGIECNYKIKNDEIDPKHFEYLDKVLRHEEKIDTKI